MKFKILLQMYKIGQKVVAIRDIKTSRNEYCIIKDKIYTIISHEKSDCCGINLIQVNDEFKLKNTIDIICGPCGHKVFYQKDCPIIHSYLESNFVPLQHIYEIEKLKQDVSIEKTLPVQQIKHN